MIKFRGMRKDDDTLVEGPYIEQYHSFKYGERIDAIFWSDDDKTYRIPVIPETVEVFLCGTWIPLDGVDETIMLKHTQVECVHQAGVTHDMSESMPCVWCLRDENKKLKAELEKHRWIPVSEKPPNTYHYGMSKDLLLVWTDKGKSIVCRGHYNKEEGWEVYTAIVSPEEYQDQITYYQEVSLPEERA